MSPGPLAFLLVAAQVVITPGVGGPPREVPSSRGRPGAPSEADIGRVEAAFELFPQRVPDARDRDRYFWSDRAEASIVRYLYLDHGGLTVPGVHVITDGQPPRAFDGGCRVISGEAKPGAAPTFRCNNAY